MTTLLVIISIMLAMLLVAVTFDSGRRVVKAILVMVMMFAGALVLLSLAGLQ